MEKNVFFDASIMYAVQPPIYNELLTQERTSLTGSKCHRSVNDCYLLLNQNRLDKQTKEVLLEQIEHSIGASGLSQLRNNYTDDQLCQFIKDKHIQSKSELHDYMQYLMYTEKKQITDKAFQDKIKESMKTSSEKDKPDKTE